MRVFQGLTRLPKGERVFALGFFDGVHLGHKKILAELVSWGHSSGAVSCVVTFSEHPRAQEREPPPLITPAPYKLDLISREGADEAAVTLFSEIRNMRAVEFLGILRSLGGMGLVLGQGARFGRAREGDAAAAREEGVQVREVAPVVSAGAKVSSTRVRKLLSRGDVEGAAVLLGRRPGFKGTVVKGEGRGREMGVPTANIRLGPNICAPTGVFASISLLGGRELPGATYVGRGLTFGGEEALAETHLFGFSGELLGEELEVLLVARLRPGRAFGSAEELAKNISSDLERARELLGVT